LKPFVLLTACVGPPVWDAKASVARNTLVLFSVIGVVLVATTTDVPFVRRVLMQ